MSAHSFESLKELVSEHSVNVVQVAAFWREARLAHPPSPERALIAVPVTLHLAGRLSAVVYADMPVAVGSQVRSRPPRTSFDRLKSAFRERRKAALLRFSVPDLELTWHGEEKDEHALALARHFAQILADEFPDAPQRLTGSFHLDMQPLIQHLSQLPLMDAGDVSRDKSA